LEEVLVSSVLQFIDAESQTASAAELSNDNRRWYAIRVQSKFENLASATLRGKGYEEFLPLYRSRRRWSDRVKELDLPLFPGYLFCRFEVQGRLLPILTTPGVISIVGAGKTPVSISDDEIAALQTVVRSGLPAVPWRCITVGTRILIEGGPLAGMEGVALDVGRKYSLVVSVPLLQRSVAVQIDREWARPIPDRIGPGAVALSERARYI
jgi:transcription antitermination factor NusG